MMNEFAVHQALEDDDEDAQHGGGHVFVVGLLAIGYDIEEVYLYLQAPSTLDELCTQIRTRRDPVQNRVLPLLRVVEPQRPLVCAAWLGRVGACCMF